MIEMIDPGLLTTVQDLGRPGLGAIGVPPSGALDRESLVAANLLVGNDRAAACLETTLIGVRFRVLEAGVAAVTGAPAAVSLDGIGMPFGSAFELPAGGVVEVGPATLGVRSYVALAGGIAAEAVLGSRSTDLLTGLGPKPLDATVRVPLGELRSGDQESTDEESQGVVSSAGLPRPAGGVAGEGADVAVPVIPEQTVVRVLAGPRLDRFESGALDRLLSDGWSVSPRSNRIGLRLEGEPLGLADRAGLHRSEGLVTGAIQVPPSGLPAVMLADRPTTGGYPVVAVVVEEDLRLVGQLRPGSPVRFELA